MAIFSPIAFDNEESIGGAEPSSVDTDEYLFVQFTGTGPARSKAIFPYIKITSAGSVVTYYDNPEQDEATIMAEKGAVNANSCAWLMPQNGCYTWNGNKYLQNAKYSNIPLKVDYTNAYGINGQPIIGDGKNGVLIRSNRSNDFFVNNWSNNYYLGLIDNVEYIGYSTDPDEVLDMDFDGTYIIARVSNEFTVTENTQDKWGDFTQNGCSLSQLKVLPINRNIQYYCSSIRQSTSIQNFINNGWVINNLGLISFQEKSLNFEGSIIKLKNSSIVLSKINTLPAGKTDLWSDFEISQYNGHEDLYNINLFYSTNQTRPGINSFNISRIYIRTNQYEVNRQSPSILGFEYYDGLGMQKWSQYSSGSDIDVRFIEYHTGSLTKTYLNVQIYNIQPSIRFWDSLDISPTSEPSTVAINYPHQDANPTTGANLRFSTSGTHGVLKGGFLRKENDHTETATGFTNSSRQFIGWSDKYWNLIGDKVNLTGIDNPNNTHHPCLLANSLNTWHEKDNLGNYYLFTLFSDKDANSYLYYIFKITSVGPLS